MPTELRVSLTIGRGVVLDREPLCVAGFRAQVPPDTAQRSETAVELRFSAPGNQLPATPRVDYVL
jgi:hypothetical protein